MKVCLSVMAADPTFRASLASLGGLNSGALR